MDLLQMIKITMEKILQKTCIEFQGIRKIIFLMVLSELSPVKQKDLYLEHKVDLILFSFKEKFRIVKIS